MAKTRVQLLLAEVRTHLVRAGLAMVRLALLPPLPGPVKKGLRGVLQLTGPMLVAWVGGQARQASAGVRHTRQLPGTASPSMAGNLLRRPCV
jgi:hypothetical protein